ncbi:MAG TPA: hypothetical protein VGD10_12975 [Allosphingosinicella sp.]|uniref:hypothetical protein n=1 Tax=Allosphingosinicella sp. TaxID=2823234 RepID=UPI002EDAA888
MFKTKAAFLAFTTLALAACSTDGQLTTEGITVTRSACPAVAIPAGTGDITLFNPTTSRDANAIDVVATITNVRSTCDETGEFITTNVTFDVQAQRRDNRGARDVTLPYFTVVVHAGNNVVAKSVSRIGLQFADGQYRAQTSGTATGQVLRSAATLPEAIRQQITRRRKAGDPDAALDPMADPAVRAAVTRASFEVLVGFQLTEEQLRYNATR